MVPTDCQMDVSGRELDVSVGGWSELLGLVIKAGGHHIHMVIGCHHTPEIDVGVSMLEKKRGLQTTPLTYTLHPGETSKRDREEGRVRKEHAVGNQTQRKTCSQEEGEGLTSRKWGTRAGFNNKEVMGLQKSSFPAELGRQCNPTERGQGNGRQGALLQRKQEFEDKAEEVEPREILFYQHFFFLMREGACSAINWNNPEE